MACDASWLKGRERRDCAKCGWQASEGAGSRTPDARRLRRFRFREPGIRPGMATAEGPSFAHPVESAVARMLDEHGIAWEYEPHEFVLQRNANGGVRMAFAPDFYLPEIDAYIECTVMRQSETTRKNRKVRLAQELHGLVVTILYRRDLKGLGLWRQGLVKTLEP